jgi:hypothetical protein
VKQGETRKSLDLDQVISATLVPMVSASEPSLEPSLQIEELNEVKGSDQNGHGHIGVESIDAVLDFTPLTRRIEVDLPERKTPDRNGVTLIGLSLGSIQRAGNQPQAI